VAILIPSQERTDEEAATNRSTATMSAARWPRPSGQTSVLLWAGLAAALVTGGLYAFGTQHTPDYTTSLFGQTGPDTFKLKSWLATGVLAFAAVQLGLALWMYGRLTWIGVAPPRVGPVHRAIGALAILLTIPIAYHCAFAYGVQTKLDTRIAVHSVAGCILYGAFVAKIVLVQSPRWRMPGWALPVVGGTLVATVAVLWFTSALWYFNDFRLPSL
jgi:Family of unknown function (DUF6529)